MTPVPVSSGIGAGAAADPAACAEVAVSTAAAIASIPPIAPRTFCIPTNDWTGVGISSRPCLVIAATASAAASASFAELASIASLASILANLRSRVIFSLNPACHVTRVQIVAPAFAATFSALVSCGALIESSSTLSTLSGGWLYKFVPALGIERLTSFGSFGSLPAFDLVALKAAFAPGYVSVEMQHG